jgi:hypothetical protein
VLDGVQEGDEIVIGPFEVIRTLIDGERVTIQETPAATEGSTANSA